MKAFKRHDFMTSSLWCHKHPWRHRSCDHWTQYMRLLMRPQ